MDHQIALDDIKRKIRSTRKRSVKFFKIFAHLLDSTNEEIP